MEKQIKSYKEFSYAGRRVLLRLDINSPLDPKTKQITDTTRIDKSLSTVNYLLEQGAKVAIIAHQGDTLDYQNLYPLAEHAKILSEKTGRKVDYIDDVCGPAAIAKIKELSDGEAIILGNLRYLAEEISTFETVVKLTPQEMTKTWLIRSLSEHFDYYVNDAFSAAHRACPSMVAFQEVLPSAAGELFFAEYSALNNVLKQPQHPSVFVLGGAKISDAFGMMEQVLVNGTADKILTTGVTGVVFLLAQGKSIGSKYEQWLRDRKLLDFVEPAKRYLEEYAGKIEAPVDLAYAQNDERKELDIAQLPMDDAMFLDIGSATIEKYQEIIQSAATLFVNGPAGVYEDPLFVKGTEALWQAIAKAPGHSVIGGGDTVQAAGKFIDLTDIGYVCTAGGAMVRFMTGKKLPLIEAMEK